MMNIETYRQVIGEKLKEMREKRNQSVESVAIKGHMDDDDVIAVESGCEVSFDTFIRYIVATTYTSILPRNHRTDNDRTTSKTSNARWKKTTLNYNHRLAEMSAFFVYKISINLQIWNIHISTFTPSDIARNLNLNVYGNGKRKARNNQQVLR